jgi:hypothetical protein
MEAVKRGVAYDKNLGSREELPAPGRLLAQDLLDPRDRLVDRLLGCNTLDGVA